MSENILVFTPYSEKVHNQFREYKYEFRSADQRWKNRMQKPIRSGILGISAGSSYATSGSKLDSGLQAIYKQVDHLYISNTYSPYQYTFMAEGLDPDAALEKAIECGKDWLQENRPIIEHYKNEAETCGKSLTVIDWIPDIRNHPDFLNHLAKVTYFFRDNQGFHKAIEDDIEALLQRQARREQGEETVQDIDRMALDLNVKAALEKIAGYWIMTQTLQNKTNSDLVLYFHNGPVSPQINFFRTHGDNIPDSVAQPLKSIVYVDITFRKRNREAA